MTRSLDAAIALLEALGARGTRWEWKKRSWRQGLEARIASWENLERGVRTRMRMCRSCRALVEGNVRTCPECGASMRMIPRVGFSRVLRLLLPGTTSASIILVSANVGMSLLVLALWGTGGGSGLASLLSPPGKALFLLGAKWTPSILGGEVWRLVTANYLHGGLIHLLFNCYALMVLGPLIEEAFGWRKFFVIYTVTGIAGFTVSALFRPGALSIGASGAIFGLLGFAFVFGRYRGGPSARAISEQLMRWLLFGVVMFLIPGIDSFAHVGGAVAGAALAMFVDPEEPKTPAADAWLWLLVGAALVVTVGSFGAMALSYGANLRALGG